MLKIPTAEIALNNKDGRFTSGSTKVPDYSKIRIKADVRGTVDDLFLGHYLRYEGDFTRRKHDVTLKCKGHALKLLFDTITYPYHSDDESRGVWTLKDVIEDLLALPDSSYDTGITLVTDSGAILTKKPIDDYDRETLLDTLRKIGEQLSYDGYMSDETHLVFKAIGTIACSPTITLSHPFVFIRPVRDIEEVRNFILPWGDVEIGAPPGGDRWTEVYNRWTGLWTGGAGCSVGNEETYVQRGSRSIYILNSTNNYPDGTLDVTKDPDYDYIDCSNGRFLQLYMWLMNLITGDILWPTIDLTDDGGNVIRHGRGLFAYGEEWPILPEDVWKEWVLPVGPGQTIRPTAMGGWWHKDWFYYSGSSFSWKITKMRIFSKVWEGGVGKLLVDGAYFRGGRKIDPLLYPSDYPECPVKDDTSITAFGRRVKHVEDREFKTFAQATEGAKRALATLKNPIKKLKVKKGAKTWARPHQTLTLNLPEYDINSETWRVLELEHEWQSRGNILRTVFSLVPQYEKISTTAIQIDELGGILRSLKR